MSSNNCSLFLKHQIVSFILFCLAIATGLLFRLGLIGLPMGGLSLENIRHAHSHLMFFGWVIPIPMIYIAQLISQQQPKLYSPFSKLLGAILITALATFLFFLSYGYQLVSILGEKLPLAAIFSGINMILWYVFILLYLFTRKHLTSQIPRTFFDASLLMLVVSSLGAWGISLAQMLDIQSSLIAKSFTHFFLTTFSEGWCLLVILGILYHQLGIEQLQVGKCCLVAGILLGAPLMFPFGISASLLTPSLLLTAQVGGLLAVLCLLFNLYLLWNKSRHWGVWAWPLGFLIIKLIMQWIAIISPSMLWVERHGLHVLYLHTLLLGGVTLTLILVSSNLSSSKERTLVQLMNWAVVLVMVSLLPLTSLWPIMLQGLWVHQFAAFAALAPLVVGLLMVWEKINNL